MNATDEAQAAARAAFLLAEGTEYADHASIIAVTVSRYRNDLVGYGVPEAVVNALTMQLAQQVATERLYLKHQDRP